jgi:hypothetical protein
LLLFDIADRIFNPIKRTVMFACIRYPGAFCALAISFALSNALRTELKAQSTIAEDAEAEVDVTTTPYLQAAFPAVGYMGSLSSGAYFGTGTLIASDRILTSAQNAMMLGGDEDGMFMTDDQSYGTSRVIIHPDYDEETLANDLAILVLNQPVDNVEPLEIYRREPMVGDLFAVVGYGSQGDGTGQFPDTFGPLNVGLAAVEDVSESGLGWTIGNVDDSNPGLSGPGSPGLIEIDGTYYVASVTSGQWLADTAFGSSSLSTRIDLFIDWIDENTNVTPPVDDGTDPEEEMPEEEEEEEEEEPNGGLECEDFFSQPFPLLRWFIGFLTNLLEQWQDDRELPGTA